MIDTNNIISKLSPDLISSVRNIMEKKQPRMDKVGKEDSDIDNDGDVDDSDEYLHNRRKVIKKSVSEAKKSKQHIEVNNHLGQTQRIPVHPTQAFAALNHYRKQPSTKSARIVSEEIEQIDELSIDTLTNYVSKAKKDPAFNKQKGRVSKERKARMDKRNQGIEKARDKLGKKHEAEYAEHKQVNDHVQNHLRQAAPGILARHGFKKVAGNNKRTIYAKANDESGTVHSVIVHNPGNYHYNKSHISTYQSTSGWQSSDDRHYHDEHSGRDYRKMSDLDKHKKDAENAFAKHIVQQHAYHHKKGLSEATGLSMEEINYIEEVLGLDKIDLTEVEDKLDEARGRPRKNPLPVGQEADGPEPRQHIMQQLQRAKLSMRGGENVTFHDGKTHHVKGPHAAKVLDKYSTMKPFEKEAYQKKIGTSHEHFKKEI